MNVQKNVLALALVAALAHPAHSAEFNWTNSSGCRDPFTQISYFTNPLCWGIFFFSPIPGVSDIAIISGTSGVDNVSFSSTVTNQQLRVRDEATLNLNGYSYTLSSASNVLTQASLQIGGYGELSMVGGAVNAKTTVVDGYSDILGENLKLFSTRLNTTDLILAPGASSRALVNVSNTSSLNVAQSVRMSDGMNSASIVKSNNQAESGSIWMSAGAGSLSFLEVNDSSAWYVTGSIEAGIAWSNSVLPENIHSTSDGRLSGAVIYVGERGSGDGSPQSPSYLNVTGGVNLGGTSGVGSGYLEIAGNGKLTAGSVTVSHTSSFYVLDDNLAIGTPGMGIADIRGALNVVGGGEVYSKLGVVDSQGVLFAPNLITAHSATVTGGLSPADSGTRADGRSKWLAKTLVVGRNGSGDLSVSDGALVLAGDVFVGAVAGSTGQITVSGADTLMEANNQYFPGATSSLFVGGNAVASGGTGTLTVDTSGRVSADLLKIWNANSSISTGSSLATATANGGIINIAGDLTLAGGTATGFLGYVDDAAPTTLANTLYVRGNANIAGSTALWQTRFLNVGAYGTGTLNITNGGRVTNSSGASIGGLANGDGTVNVGETNSLWDITSVLDVGGVNGASGGAGTLTVNAGGHVKAGSLKVWNANSGVDTTGGGVVRVAGALTLLGGGTAHSGWGAVDSLGVEFASNMLTATSASVTGAGSSWNMGTLIAGRGGNGTLTVNDGGNVGATYGYIGEMAGSAGQVIVGGAGANATLNIGAGGLFVGGNTVTSGGGGTLTVNTGGHVKAGSLKVWNANSGVDTTGGGVVNVVGAMTLVGGGTANSGWGAVDSLAAEFAPDMLTATSASVTGAGSSWNMGTLIAGRGGNGILIVNNGGNVGATYGYIGEMAGSNGQLKVGGAGASATVNIGAGGLFVGGNTVTNGGTGTLTVNTGGHVKAGSLKIWNANSGIDTTGGGVVRVAGALTLLGGGTAHSGWGAVDSLGVEFASNMLTATSASVTGAGSSWNMGTLIAGRGGNGTLTVNDGGNVGATYGYIGEMAGSAGQVIVGGAGANATLNIGAGGLFVGGNTVTSGGGGTLTVNTGGHVKVGSLKVWNANSSIDTSGGGVIAVAGELALTNGGTANSKWGAVDSLGELFKTDLVTASSASVTGAGSGWNTSSLIVGRGGSGALAIENGAQVNAVVDATVGQLAGSIGQISVGVGGSLDVGSIVNGAGTGTLNLDGGTITVGGGSGSIDVDNLVFGQASGADVSYTLSATGLYEGTHKVANILAVSGLTLGKSGTSHFNQSSGTNQLKTDLTLGAGGSGNGTYALSGTGALSAVNEFVGHAGTGNFNQSGGTNTVNGDLTLGAGGSGNGTYALSGTGTLSAVNEFVGHAGTGNFTQSAGTNTVIGNLYVGSNSSAGTYDLSGGVLSAANEFIGVGGSTGSFTQSGGTHTVTNVLTLGEQGDSGGGDGTYRLSGGTLNVGNIASTGGTSTSDLIIDGGTLNLTGTSIDLYGSEIGSASGSNGHFTLAFGQTFAARYQVIGLSGTGSFIQNGGTYAATSGMFLGTFDGSAGTYTLNAGTLDVASMFNGAGTSTMNLNGGALTVGGGNGTIAVDSLGLATTLGSNVSYTLAPTGLYDGTDRVASALTVGRILNGAGTSTLNIEGGGVNFPGTSIDVDNFNVGSLGGSSGSFAVASGKTLTADNLSVSNPGSGLATGALTDLDGGQIAANALSIAGGGNVTSRGAYVGGGNAGLLNAVTVAKNADISGAGSLWQARFLSIGYGAKGAVDVGDGGRVATTNNLIVGETSVGELNANAGGIVDAGMNAYVGRTSGVAGIVAVGGTGATWNVGDSVYLGGDNLGAGGSGSLTVDANGVVNIVNTLKTWAGGAATVNGLLNATSVRNLGVIDGTGTINANVFNSNGGVVGPGNSPGLLNIAGDYSQDAYSSLSVEIGGPLAGDYDVLNVGGTADLNGTLDVILYDLGGGVFVPHAGDSFDILAARTLQGTFSTKNYATLAPNLVWHIDYLTDAVGTTDVVRLSVLAVPEPETWLMMLAGLGMLGVIARRRQQAWI